METKKCYEDDAYTIQFEATVCSCEPMEKLFLVTLDRTYFYPEGGGQPADLGRLGAAVVKDVRQKDGVVQHITDRPLTVGETVEGQIDWDRRFDLMQNHSGEHILSGIICRKYGCDNVGFHMGKETILIDFNVKIPQEDLLLLEREANQAIWKNIPSHVTYPSQEELERMAYRSKKALEGRVRILEIGTYDRCACCGTHVKQTGEIGLIKILSAQNYKGGTRLEIVCGMRALADYAQKTEQAAAISEMLSVPTGQIAQAVGSLQKERDRWQQMVSRMKWEKIHLLAGQAETAQVCCFVQDFDSKDAVHLADAILEKTRGTAAVFAQAKEGFLFVLMSRTEDMRLLAAKLKEQFNSKGGGKAEAVQGRTEADAKQLQAFWTEQGFTVMDAMGRQG